MCRCTRFLLGCCVLAVAALLAFATAPAFAYTISGTPAQTATVATITDDMFANNQWSATKYWDTTSSDNASFSASQKLTGGNSGDYRQVCETYYNGAENVLNLYTARTYNPQTQGVVDDINYSYDAKLINPPAGNAAVGSWLALVQGVDKTGKPVIFYSSYNKVTSTSWTTFHQELMTADDFTSYQPYNPGAPLHPDFAATGSSMSFGFITSNSLGGAGATNVSGWDNFSVDIVGPAVPTPEPATLTLLALGGLMISRRRSRAN